MPSLDGEYRRHPRPEYRLHYSGDVGRLLVGYDKVCRFVNVRTIEEALAARLKDHQSPADGKQDEADQFDDAASSVTALDDTKRATIVVLVV